MDSRRNSAGDVEEILRGLALPPEEQWQSLYERAYRVHPLPFPLGYLVQGLRRSRDKEPATFIAHLSWFFEVAYRFLLAVVLRPYIRNLPIDEHLWPFFETIFLGRDATPKSMGAWRDFAFDCLARVIENPKALGQVPHFLSRYAGGTEDFARLRRLNDVAVHFRNRLSHSVRDGNAPDSEKGAAALYERAFIRLLLDLEQLGDYSLVMYNPEEGGYEEVGAHGQTLPLSATSVPDGSLQLSQGKMPQPYELLLAQWRPDRSAVAAAWSMYPFLTITPPELSGGQLQVRLFERFIDAPNNRVVRFDMANLPAASVAGAATQDEDSSTELVDVVAALARILRDRRDKGRKPSHKSDAADTARLAEALAEQLAVEDARRSAELEEAARRRRESFGRRIGHPADPLFRGRTEQIQQLIDGLREKKSLQIRSLIWGMGGVGKTSLAVHVCYRLIDENVFADGILWYRVREEGPAEVIKRCSIDLDMDPDVNAIADIDARVDEFQHRLRKLDVLVVLDNADYGPETMRPILGLFRGMPVLITSRRELDLPGSLTIQLGDLSDQEAVDLVSDLLGFSQLGGAPMSRYGSVEELKKLCRALGSLPLALVLAAARIREQPMTISGYLAAWRMRRDRLALLSADRVDETEEKLRDVRACFGLSLDDLVPRERRVLAYMGLWQGREFSLGHLERIVDESIYFDVPSHDGAITAAVKLPDGIHALTAGVDGRVLVWNVLDSMHPRTIATAFHSDSPILDLLVHPEQAYFMVQTASGWVIAVNLLDAEATRIGRAFVPRALWDLNQRARCRIPMFVRHDGLVAMRVDECDVRAELLLAWPSQSIPLQTPIRMHRFSVGRVQIRPEDGFLPDVAAYEDCPGWLMPTLGEWKPVPAAPLVENGRKILLETIARHLDYYESWSEFGATSSEGRAFLSELAEIRERVESDTIGDGWDPLRGYRHALDGLHSLSIRLRQFSLVETRMSEAGERLRVHPLVSEFAAEQLGRDEHERGNRAMSAFYLEEFSSDHSFLDADYASVEIAWRNELHRTSVMDILSSWLLSRVQRAWRARNRPDLALDWAHRMVDAASAYGSQQQQLETLKVLWQVIAECEDSQQ